MTPAEFYVKYWMVIDKDGNRQPNTLTKEAIAIWDAAFELGEIPWLFFRGRRGDRLVINQRVEEHMNKSQSIDAQQKLTN